MWIALGILLLTVVGAISAFHAVMRTRTAQGAIAWVVSLIAMPALAVPAYWFLGRRKFQGYLEAWSSMEEAYRPQVAEIHDKLKPFFVEPSERVPSYEALRKLAHWPLQRGNAVDLLVDGEATFDSILEGIEAATAYVLVEFYIVHDDGLGRRLKEALVKKAREGVRVWFVYDELGSSGLPSSYVDEIRAAGGEMHDFGTRQGRGNLFQVNFRNHRKIVVVDGRVGWVGGHNVGDEYLGLDPKVGPWRDTHVRIEGPAVHGLQATFSLDWFWATREVLDLSWEPVPSARADQHALVVATGPADDRETAKLFFIHAINVAKKRIWIATPYFIPDPAVSAALELAALRGIDIRILTPKNNDSTTVQLSSYYFIQELDGLGIQFAQYAEGFMHQKVMLVDDDVSFVGTHNFDSRSFVLNFEVTALIHDAAFARESYADGDTSGEATNNGFYLSVGYEF